MKIIFNLYAVHYAVEGENYLGEQDLLVQVSPQEAKRLYKALGELVEGE